MNNKRLCFQWSVYLVALNEGASDSVQQGLRPCICVSNDRNNTWSSIAQFIPLTSQIKNTLPMHYILLANDYKFLKTDSVVLTEQLTTCAMNKVVKFLGRLNDNDIENIKNCIKIEFDL